MSDKTIWFYVPTHEVAAETLPQRATDYWDWVGRRGEVDAWGPYDWTLQTFLHLKPRGAPYRLTHTLPSEGIVVAHRDFFPDELRPGPKQYLVSIVGDREEPGLSGRHRYAQFTVQQNPRDPLLQRPDPLWNAAFMTFWPQSNLLPRDEDRGATFENAAFFGYPQNLADSLHESAWRAALSELGLNWEIPPRWKWNDYRNVDVVVAIRSFSGRPFDYKPASKLLQAWQAGVPSVLGAESAYQAERLSDLDYLEAATFADAVAALRRLRNDPSLRQAMMENGKRRALENLPERIAERWHRLLIDVATPAWERWCSLSNGARDNFLQSREEAQLVPNR
jgi:hypothetical protein